MTSYPLIDEENPFYCPTVSATSYVNSLRQLRAQAAHSQDDKRPYSFARVLDQALLVNLGENSPQDQPGQRAVSFGDDGSSPSLDGAYPIPAWEQEGQTRHPPASIKRKLSFSSNSFSDIERPAKYGRSLQSVHESSFELSVKAQRLLYFAPNGGYSGFKDHTRPGKASTKPNSSVHAKIRILEGTYPTRTAWTTALLDPDYMRCVDELYGPPIGTETPRGLKPLMARLDALLPGMRLNERLQHLDDPTHQKIANILAENGLLNTRVLDMLRTSEIRCLSLTNSLLDEDGLNMSGRDMLHVFNKPNSFLFLSELCFSDTPLEDFDLVHIHHLPRLATLILSNTGVGNEAVFLLISLKRSLNQLSISSNPRIGNYAVPALLLLSRLSFLSILDTNIDMVGLRRLATTIYKEDRIISIEIPVVCEYYIDNLHSKYLVHPSPPLIVNPAMCAQLSVASLKRNLAGHAKCNPDISTSGTKVEMANRLEKILKTREMDMLARGMIWGNDVDSG